MTQVVFNSATFKIRYPEFSAVADARLQLFFNEATLYLSNADNSPVQNITRRTMYLDMLTAHIATLNGVLNADGSLVPVGRVSNASEGSVSVALEFQVEAGSAQWYAQTQYGAAYWQAVLTLRRFRYIPQPTVY